jgi:hypothetical protein
MAEMRLQLRALAMVQQQLAETLDLASPLAARSSITPWVGLAGEAEQGAQRRPGTDPTSEGSLPLEQLPAALSTQVVQVRGPRPAPLCRSTHQRWRCLELPRHAAACAARARPEPEPQHPEPQRRLERRFCKP